MSKYTVAGLVSWLFSGLLLGFQALATFMKMEDKMVWKSLTLLDFLNEGHLTWLDGISRGTLHTIIYFIVTMPLYMLLFFTGILFFIMNRLTSRR
ncbi:MAG: hypothetical protein JRD87_09150 [Deltaproteobacteria bacterium]|jgi:hypothetical protein|nr:hypothetical protein [Deltaproteobacteria bacterium]MBW2239826.1 hypothetical protein [Deltaproteobacteria bacterium]MBW2572824.1 hypothetical protein [Deltaproteobacteria bacterium]MBW2670031.1 hypothetical protein [Deltaproteobacteria bacterium]MBW2711176.1 hypothetical protein [Deltaproteobacteria bacterium]